MVAPNLVALKVNPATEDKGKRSHRDEKPEKDSLKERSNAHFAESPHGEPCSNQVERDGQANNAKMLQHRIRGLEDKNVRAGDGCQAEEESTIARKATRRKFSRLAIR